MLCSMRDLRVEVRVRVSALSGAKVCFSELSEQAGAYLVPGLAQRLVKLRLPVHVNKHRPRNHSRELSILSFRLCTQVKY